MLPNNVLFQWKVVPFWGMGWLMACTMCLVKIWCMGSYDMIVWCNQCCRDNRVDHHEICEVQVHVMAWCDQPEWMSLGFQSDHTLDYKTWRGFRVIIESLTAQHNTHPTPTLLHSSTMSMINSYQFRTPQGNISNTAKYLFPNLFSHQPKMMGQLI